MSKYKNQISLQQYKSKNITKSIKKYISILNIFAVDIVLQWFVLKTQLGFLYKNAWEHEQQNCSIVRISVAFFAFIIKEA